MVQLEIMLSENTTDPNVCISPNHLSYVKSGMQRDHENEGGYLGKGQERTNAGEGIQNTGV